jgi:hypothetical protein
MAKRKKPRKPPKPASPKLIRIRDHELRALIREAAHTGLATAIEHCSNFWQVSDDYKRYIDHQIRSQAEALMAAVRVALREELAAQVRQRLAAGFRRKRSKPKGVG